MGQITVKELLEICKQAVRAGYGEKHIAISDDNEGNGYHGLFYGFTPLTEDFNDLIYDSRTSSPCDTIILG